MGARLGIVQSRVKIQEHSRYWIFLCYTNAVTSSFNDSTKQIADELIVMSALLDKKMETWAEVFTLHPDSQNTGICAGFISNQASVNRIEVLIDVQAPSDTDSGIVRTRAIETIRDKNGNERFNNVSLQYSVDYASAQKLVEKGKSIAREDIKQLLNADSSQLNGLVISNATGRDSASQALLGKRYDFDVNELAVISEATEKEVLETTNTVLARLKQTAASEA